MLPEVVSHICRCFTRVCIRRVMSSAARNFFDIVVTRNWSGKNINNNINNNNNNNNIIIIIITNNNTI